MGFRRFSVYISTDVYPNSHFDRVHVSQCICVSGDALPAQGLCHHFPPRTECPEEEEELQGLISVSSSHYFSVVWLLMCCFDSLLQTVVQVAKLSQKSLTEKQNGEMKIEPDRMQ